MKFIQSERLSGIETQEFKRGTVGLQPPQGFPFTGRVYYVRNHQSHYNPSVAVRQADILEHPGKARSIQGRQCKALASHRMFVLHFRVAELNACGIAIQRLIRGLHRLAASQFLHNGLRSCHQFSGGLEEESIPGKPCLDDFNRFGPLGLGDGKACSEVEKRFLLHLATNSAALDQANGSTGFVRGAAGQGLAGKLAPTIEVSNSLGTLERPINSIYGTALKNLEVCIHKINALLIEESEISRIAYFFFEKCGR